MFEDLKKKPILTDGQLYIYVIESSGGNIKIGKSTDVLQRFKSLSGSNANGYEIIRYTVSPPTWLYSIETTAHNHFDKYRVGGEWFSGITFEEARDYVKSLFLQPCYKRCNEERKKYILQSKNK